jgi:hypothetical protein
MKYDKELIDLVKKREFKTFWHCLDYLMLAGYRPIDAFGVTMQEFGEGRIYSDVAFIKVIGYDKTIIDSTNFNPKNEFSSKVIVGIIDHTNIHLSGIYDTYRRWLSLGINEHQEEIDQTCEIIVLKSLTFFLLAYLHGVGKLHFGYEAFEMPKRVPVPKNPKLLGNTNQEHNKNIIHIMRYGINGQINDNGNIA